ncbi:hypothetical protein MKX08_009907 [Trichoderma sp. CBMAI-0020]|nr:hypothetical protein MKX08_009907 [Trichoderma sp. CBMAI-0020]
MPLHLLGKKSWNVYNADNIARVRRDEAAAKAAEQAEEQRMQEVDAQRRLAILRGEAPAPLEDEREAGSDNAKGASGDARSKFPVNGRKKRKQLGEDDTDFELRLAKERNNATYAIVESSRKVVSSAPIVDHAGHIDLFGDERARAHAEKNPEAEADRKKKEREYEDQYTMRFSNAAGKDGISQPWYSHGEGVAPDISAKNVWGRDDPERKARDTQRISSSDPLAMMKKGAMQKATAIDTEIGIRKEKDETADAIQMPRGMIQGGRDQEIEIRIRMGALMIVRGEGIKRMSGGRGIATHGRAHQIGGGADIDTMKDEVGRADWRTVLEHRGIMPNVH